ncbi:MAG: hypothetical protein GY862_37715 [Gammaproteobacteria bacterium]|nr:hypothetical protein [Gammaproteobacteria bacterium]
MAIEAADVVQHMAVAMNQTGSAGGKMSDITVAHDVMAGIIDDIAEAERVNGAERKYKIFFKIGNADNKTYQNAVLYSAFPLQGDCVSGLLKGTFADVWSDASGGRKYGCADIKSATTLNAGDTTATVNTRGQSYGHFQAGDKVAAVDQTEPADITGHAGFKTLTAADWNGDQAALTFDSGLRYAYASSRRLNGVTVRTRVSSCIEYGNVIGAFSVSDKAGAEGAYAATDTVSVDSIAGITQTFTFTFDSSTSFAVAGDSPGELPPGTAGSVYQPQNPDYLRPWLSVPPEFRTGTWAAGDTVKIHTNPCAMPVWRHITVPPGTQSVDLERQYIWGNGHSGSL